MRIVDVFFLACLGLSLIANELKAEEPPDFARIGRPFLQKHCLGCHSGKKPKAAFSLVEFRDSTSIVRNREVWKNVLKMVRGGNMPPKGRPRPTATEVNALIAHVKAVFDYHDRHELRQAAS